MRNNTPWGICHWAKICPPTPHYIIELDEGSERSGVTRRCSATSTTPMSPPGRRRDAYTRSVSYQHHQQQQWVRSVCNDVPCLRLLQSDMQPLRCVALRSLGKFIHSFLFFLFVWMSVPSCFSHCLLTCFNQIKRTRALAHTYVC